jgi:hypothetical protein
LDPEKPGRFILGIECDGAQYHSSRSARDRDRLRQQVLEEHGWIIHRIWGADWYMRPEAELKRIEDTIEAARAEWASRDEGLATPKPFEATTGRINGDAGEETAADPPAQLVSVTYREAEFAVNRSMEPHKAPLSQMTNYVVKIVEVEGPIHIDEIIVRIKTLWGLGRAGARIRAAVERAIATAEREGLVEADGDFYRVNGSNISVRNRSRVASPTLRRPDMLPRAEIERAILDIVDTNFGATRGELVQAAARSFGFASTSSQLRAAFSYVIDGLLALGQLVEQGDFLRRPNDISSDHKGPDYPALQ